MSTSGPRRNGPFALLIAALLATSLAAVPPPAAATDAHPPDEVALQIYNGRRASIADLPWIVLVSTPTSGCTGSVVAPRWVLTAAHCFSSTSTTGVQIAIGGDTMSSFTEVIPAARIVLHPGWNPTNLRGDIALVELATATSAPALPLATAGAADPVGARAIITGWGMLDEVRSTDVLMRAEVPVLHDRICVDTYGPDAYDPSTFVCAGGEGVDVCAGDSGGPLITTSAAGPVAVGVVSYGQACSPASTTVGAYTAVSAYRSWIETTTGGTGGGTTPPPDPTPPTSFRDVPSTHRHHATIMLLASSGITGGYADGTFRPDRVVTRGQMATFLMRAADLRDPGGATGFRDVTATSTHAAGIRAVRAAGITGGYDDGTFRPDRAVTRGQMATFLTRAAGMAGGPLPAPFWDVTDGNAHAPAISRVAAEGITGGYDDASYRPGRGVTRAQMATFLARTFLGAPRGTPPAPPTGLQLATACRDWHLAACDRLYLESPAGSDAARFGDTCGGRIPEGTGMWCVDAFANPLAQRCTQGSMSSCDRLFVEARTTWDRRFGDTCGWRQREGTGRWCVDSFG